MMRTLVRIALCWLVAAPAAAGSLLFWEENFGAPGATAVDFPHGTGLLADLDFDADSAEGGGLLLGATEIEIRPTGSTVFVAFVCELPRCNENVDYRFEPGGEGAGGLVLVSDPDFSEKHGVHDLGTLEFDAEDDGTVELVDCNYTGLDDREHHCSPFTLIALPEPGIGAPLLAALALLAGPLRRRAVRKLV